MNTKQKLRIQQLVESCRHTDNTELDLEKTAVIEELLAEVSRYYEALRTEEQTD